jgi:glycosyltransferase involved in cell wall biosynthesis
MRLSVIVPARNEADVLRPCLESLLAQSEPGFAVAEDWELLLVDDGSTDATRSIALDLPHVTVLDPEPLKPGWTGKANAVWTAAGKSQGEWLLFTDADTIHAPGNLERALHEAQHAGVAMLSYSPRQVVTGFWQRALMPLIFSELALAYPPEKVSDPSSRVAAANGQFLLIERAAYFQVGGHSAVAASLLEDVDLAVLLKRRKFPIRFRYAPDALSTRMYRSFGAMVWLRVLWRFYARVAKSNFSALDCALSVFALPLFCLLLARSWWQHTVRSEVAWKGRAYSTNKR